MDCDAALVSSETVMSYIEEALVDIYKCNVAEHSVEAGPSTTPRAPVERILPHQRFGRATIAHIAAGMMDAVCAW